mgnify:CR=1 FL=1
MKWIKIDRDDNGFATEEVLDIIVELHKNGVPIAMLCIGYGDSYAMLSPDQDIYSWCGEIERNTGYTHYLPLPKLEL